MTPAIERIETNDREARKAIVDAIEAFNDARTGRPEPARSFGLLLRDAETQQITGGLWAVTYYDWMFVDLLVVPKNLRGQGLGTSLLRQAEDIARSRGCIGVWLDTFSFQARPFYERLGYRLFGEIPDYPPGHSRFFLSKRLDRTA